MTHRVIDVEIWIPISEGSWVGLHSSMRIYIRSDASRSNYDISSGSSSSVRTMSPTATWLVTSGGISPAKALAAHVLLTVPAMTRLVVDASPGSILAARHDGSSAEAPWYGPAKASAAANLRTAAHAYSDPG